MHKFLASITLSAILLIALVWSVAGQDDTPLTSFEPFAIDVQQSVPVTVTLNVPLTATDTQTVTVPMNVDMDMRISVSSPLSAVVDVGQAEDATVEMVESEVEPAGSEVSTIISPGTHLVGKDIQPGLYRGEGGDDIMDSCYWERLSDLSGEFSGTIANENATGQFYVEVKESDFALKVDCELEKVED